MQSRAAVRRQAASSASAAASSRLAASSSRLQRTAPRRAVRRCQIRSPRVLPIIMAGAMSPNSRYVAECWSQAKTPASGNGTEAATKGMRCRFERSARLGKVTVRDSGRV